MPAWVKVNPKVDPGLRSEEPHTPPSDVLVCAGSSAGAQLTRYRAAHRAAAPGRGCDGGDDTAGDELNDSGGQKKRSCWAPSLGQSMQGQSREATGTPAPRIADCSTGLASVR